MAWRVLGCALMALILADPLPAQESKNLQIFDRAWQAVQEHFYDPSFLGKDWKAIRDQYRPDARQAPTDRDLTVVLTRMLRELPVSHLQITPPASVRTFTPAVRTLDVDGSPVIGDVRLGSDAQYKGLQVGDRVITPLSVLRGPLGSSVDIEVSACDDTLRKVSVRREDAASPPDRPSLRWHQIRQDEKRSIGYLKAVRFDDDAAPLIDRAMGDLATTTGLIIDVRGNGGGNLSALRLVSYFTEPRLAVAVLGRAYLNRLGAAPSKVSPATLPRVSGALTTQAILAALQKEGGVAFYSEDLPRYQGRVVVLVDAGTGSAAEGFAWLMREMTAAAVVGRQTAGAILGGETFDLTEGWRITIPTHAAWGPTGTAVHDLPLTPEFLTRWTRDDYCRGRDPDVSQAVDLLASGR